MKYDNIMAVLTRGGDLDPVNPNLPTSRLKVPVPSSLVEEAMQKKKQQEIVDALFVSLLKWCSQEFSGFWPLEFYTMPEVTED